MRILLLNDRIDPVGGSQLMTRELMQGLKRRGHEVRILASRAGLNASDLGAAPEAEYTCFGTLGRVQSLSRTFNPSAALSLRQALSDFDPHVVHVRAFLTQLSPAILPLLRHRPSVMHAVMYDAICPIATKLLPDGRVCEQRAGWVCRQACLSRAAFIALMTQRALWRRWRGAFDVVIANSSTTAAKLEAEEIGPVRVIWNAVPATAARPPLADPPTAAVVGRLSREKGVDVAIRAFSAARSAVPAAKLLVVGAGPERAGLEALVRELSVEDAVEFSGRLPRAEMEAKVQSAWVQLVPSIWDEPFGLVAAEAMMRGTAVIASHRGGPAEIVVDGVCGTLVRPGDADAFAAALASILGDRSRAEAMGRAGRERALASFSMDRMLNDVEAVYHEVSPGCRQAEALCKERREFLE